MSLAQKALLTFCLLILSLQALQQANPAVDELGSDGGIYLYVGSMIEKGKLPYVDAMETKPPLIFYLNALGYWLGRETRWGLWLVEFAFIAGAILFGYLLVKKIFGPVPAIISNVLWPLALPDMLLQGNFTEEFSLLPNFLAIYLYWRFHNKPNTTYFAFIGILFSCSFLIRPNNALAPVLLVGMVALADLYRRRWMDVFSKIGWFLAGFALPFFIVLFYFMYKGIAQNYIEAAYLYNFLYSNPQTKLSLWNSSLLPGFSKLGLVAWLAAIGYLINLYLVFRERQLLNFYLALLWPLEIVLSGLSGRGYGHYFIIWLPTVALLLGVLVAYLANIISGAFSHKLSDKWAAQNILPFMLAFLLSLAFFGELKDYSQAFYRILFDRKNSIEYVDPVSWYVRTATQPNDFVLVWGVQPKINVMAHREAPTPYVFYPLFIQSPYSEKYAAGYLNDLKTNPPVLVVDVSDYNKNLFLSLDFETRSLQMQEGQGWKYAPENINDVISFLEANYHQEKVIKTKQGRATIYRINQ